MPLRMKYRSLIYSGEDTFLTPIADCPPISESARNKIHGVSPESIMQRRLRHPEEFGITRRAKRQ